jgi:RimJ/RimL family protein N-acetyltransferase
MIASVLTTDRLLLLRPEEGHFTAFADFYASARAAERGWLCDTSQARSMWEAHCAHWVQHGFGLFILAERESGRLLGLCGLCTAPHMPDGELVWALWHDEDEGKGLAYEAAAAVRDFAFGDMGWKTAVSYIADDNPKSVALAKRLGAKADGEWTTPGGHRFGVYRHLPPEPRA